MGRALANLDWNLHYRQSHWCEGCWNCAASKEFDVGATIAAHAEAANEKPDYYCRERQFLF
jgi:hypothetical protein